jgi:hypothetical protein
MSGREGRLIGATARTGSSIRGPLIALFTAGSDHASSEIESTMDGGIVQAALFGLSAIAEDLELGITEIVCLAVLISVR